MIYILCRDHKINRKLLTPRRDHLLFPYDDGKGEHHSSRSKAFGILPDEDEVEKHPKGISGNILRGDPINRNWKKVPGKVSKSNLSSSMTFSKNARTHECRSLKEPSPMKNNVAHISGKLSIASMNRIPGKDAAKNVSTGSDATLRTAQMEKR